MGIKVAVCIAGELRTWSDTCMNIFNFFDSVPEVDYYMITWVTNTINPYGANSKRGKVEVVDQESVKSSFSGQNLIDCKFVDLNSIKQCYDNAFNRFRSNNGNGLYAKYACLGMKSKHEMDNDMEYDFVFLLRPDIVLFSDNFDISGWNRTDDWLYTYSKSCRTHFNNHLYWNKEIMIYGTSSMMDKVADIFQYYETHDPYNFLYDCPEHIVGDYFKKFNIESFNDNTGTASGVNFDSIGNTIVRDGHNKSREWFIDMDKSKLKCIRAHRHMWNIK